MHSRHIGSERGGVSDGIAVALDQHLESEPGDQAAAEKIRNKDSKKSDKRGMLKKGKSMLGKSMKGGLLKKAKKKVKKAVKRKKKVEEPEQRQIYRQPSQGSRLMLDLDGECCHVTVK